ncbi:MAG TPA: glycosyltransferase family 2 protein [Vicinamibacteria bacterium]
MSGERLELSVVTMLYRSEAYLREFHARALSAAGRLTPSFELVYVDDGSPDASAATVRELGAGDPRVVLVELSRNFGHHRAAVAGIAHAHGRRVFMLDVDLEERPEWLPEFSAQMDGSGADVVFGVSVVRKGTFLRRVLGGVFWKLFNALSDVKVPENPCTVRLMSRRYVDALLTLPDRNLFLAGSFAWLGFRQEPRVVEKGMRRTASTYTARRLVALFIDALTSFTSYPLRIIFTSGIAIATLAIVSGSALALYKLARPEAISLGWASIVVSIWFLGGLTISFLGVIGIYLAKVFNETKGRPLYVVKAVHGRDAKP